MPRRAGNRRSALTTVLLLLIAVTAVALIGLSPIALGIFHGATGKWERLSFIGQTYGAASAIVSVLALVGIVLTLSYQARDLHHGQPRCCHTRYWTTALTSPDSPLPCECRRPIWWGDRTCPPSWSIGSGMRGRMGGRPPRSCT